MQQVAYQIKTILAFRCAHDGELRSGQSSADESWVTAERQVSGGLLSYWAPKANGCTEVLPLVEYRPFLVGALSAACSVAIGQSPFALASSSPHLRYDLSL